jgi:hypothetical protein
MEKRLKFLYRYFTTSRRWRRWLNLQVLLALAASAMFFIALFTSTAPLSAQNDTPAATQALPQTPSANPQATVTRTPFPPEFLTNSEQTVGITFVAGLLVLIILVGTAMFLPKNTVK